MFFVNKIDYKYFCGVANSAEVGAFGHHIDGYDEYDAYVARFQDNAMADYKSAQAFVMDSISKAENTNVIVYPNPSTGVFKVVSTNNEAITEIYVTDLTGRLVYNNKIESDITETETNVNFLPVGTYFISVTTNVSNYNLKLVIVK